MCVNTQECIVLLRHITNSCGRLYLPKLSSKFTSTAVRSLAPSCVSPSNTMVFCHSKSPDLDMCRDDHALLFYALSPRAPVRVLQMLRTRSAPSTSCFINLSALSSIHRWQPGHRLVGPYLSTWACGCTFVLFPFNLHITTGQDVRL